MTVEDPPDIGPLCLLSAPASDARIRPLVGSSKTQGEQMPHPDRIVVDTISVSPVDSRGNRGEQRYWRAKKGREYLGAQWATRTEARAWALALAQEDLGIAPAATAAAAAAERDDLGAATGNCRLPPAAAAAMPSENFEEKSR